MMPTASTGPPSPAAEQPPQDKPLWGIHLQPSGAIFLDRRSLYYVRLTGAAYELALQLARTGSLRATS